MELTNNQLCHLDGPHISFPQLNVPTKTTIKSQQTSSGLAVIKKKVIVHGMRIYSAIVKRDEELEIKDTQVEIKY